MFCSKGGKSRKTSSSGSESAPKKVSKKEQKRKDMEKIHTTLLSSVFGAVRAHTHTVFIET